MLTNPKRRQNDKILDRNCRKLRWSPFPVSTFRDLEVGLKPATNEASTSCDF